MTQQAAIQQARFEQPPKQQQTPLAIKALRTFFRGPGSLLPETAAKLAYHLWFTPPRKKIGPKDREWMSSAQEQYTILQRGQKVFVRSWGKGPTVLLVHGWGGRSTQFRPLIEQLVTRGFRTICFDAVAHGSSEGRTADIEDWRMIINGITQREPAIHGVIGHSMGCLATAYALRTGTRLGASVWIAPLVRIGRVYDWFKHELRLPEKVALRMKQKAEARLPHFGESFWSEMNLDQILPQLAIDGLLIHDVEDEKIPIAQVDALNQAWQPSKYLITEGLGHSKLLKDQKVMDEVCNYLQRNVFLAQDQAATNEFRRSR